MNKTENTPENKAAFAAQYIGCELIVTEPASAIWYPFDEGEDCLTLVGILNNQLIVRRIAEDVRDKYDQCCLSLKPLSRITDEDAIEFIKMVSPYTGRIEIKERIVGGIVFDCPYVGEQLLFRFKNLAIHKKNTEEEFNQYYTYSPILHLRGIDFLRSKGYLLPWRDLSVDDIISYGWAKYEA